ETVSSLQAELTAAQAGISEQITTLQTSNDSLAADLTGITTERDDLQGQLAALQAQVGEFNDINIALDQQLQAVTDELNELQASIDAQAVAEPVVPGPIVPDPVVPDPVVPGADTTQADLPAGAQGLHIIQEGETLSAIAQLYYGDATLWPEIVTFNEFLEIDPDTIEIGDTLFIPDLAITP
ncbi:MAG: LysM peptidoglycan-binding domain-containing protein, partial [Deinococcota bacterium]